MHNLKPKKFWGQHFLTDLGIAQKIVDLCPADSTDTVIEIGPGQGVLTQFLLPKYPAFKVVEIDPDAVTYLLGQLGMKEEQIIHKDVLKWQMQEDIPADSHFVGNLPYNISSPFFFQLLENLPYVKSGAFMIQDEVARRICAGPGSKTYGILSVLLGAYFDLKYEFKVPPGVFRPPPKVMSGVLSLKRKDELPEIEFPQLKRVVKQAFSMRRKTLRNALKTIEFKNREQFDELFTRRAETLSVEEYLMLTRNLS
ncbi:MAG: 16S rRNA (adenine(1518)-N(6)/adenine(1519)-N(6))-dimethyltransferase RsmA [Bacteroidia bacterium]|nr:16S rRNA (adenine(1518)-N(6)/adenine(1519)-N(6))-dimethyltransferase RsmA [Bacteroidia bacterium]